jgi:hypothetical protein
LARGSEAGATSSTRNGPPGHPHEIGKGRPARAPRARPRTRRALDALPGPGLHRQLHPQAAVPGGGVKRPWRETVDTNRERHLSRHERSQLAIKSRKGDMTGVLRLRLTVIYHGCLAPMIILQSLNRGSGVIGYGYSTKIGVNPTLVSPAAK